VDAPTEVERALREVLPRASGDALGEFVRTGLRQQADGRWTWRWDPKLLKARLAPTAEFLWRTLPNVACPALLVRGTDSVHLPLDVAERIVASLPHGALASIPDSGNFHWFENPAGTETAIRKFLLREPDTSATH
jgi:pimeloyl-ACP methyl ester carboxylesterase